MPSDIAPSSQGVPRCIEGSVAIVTGANRGLGRHLAQELLRRGAAKVYAAARNPAQITTAGVVPLALDVNDARSVTAATVAAPDATLLVNNAGNYNEATLLEVTRIPRRPRDRPARRLYGHRHDLRVAGCDANSHRSAFMWSSSNLAPFTPKCWAGRLPPPTISSRA